MRENGEEDQERERFRKNPRNDRREKNWEEETNLLTEVKLVCGEITMFQEEMTKIIKIYPCWEYCKHQV